MNPSGVLGQRDEAVNVARHKPSLSRTEVVLLSHFGDTRLPLNPISFAGIDQKNTEHGYNFTRSSELGQPQSCCSVELKETVSALQRLLIRQQANFPISNPLPSESGSGHLDDRKK